MSGFLRYLVRLREEGVVQEVFVIARVQGLWSVIIITIRRLGLKVVIGWMQRPGGGWWPGRLGIWNFVIFSLCFEVEVGMRRARILVLRIRRFRV